jgi:hypothetical protein
MNNFSLTRLDNFGYFQHLEWQSMRSISLLNLWGYIPIISAMSGLIRLEMVNEDLKLDFPNRRDKEFYNTMKIRGIIEIFSCGFIFIIPDLFVTIGRLFHRFLITLIKQ